VSCVASYVVVVSRIIEVLVIEVVSGIELPMRGNQSMVVFRKVQRKSVCRCKSL
jgi:hypothetical protein